MLKIVTNAICKNQAFSVFVYVAITLGLIDMLRFTLSKLYFLCK